MDPFLAINLYLITQAALYARRYRIRDEEDLVQEVWATVLPDLDFGRPLGALCSYCGRRLLWLALDRRRRERGQPVALSQLREAEGGSPIDLAVDAGPTPDVVVGEADWFARALGLLPERERLPLSMRLRGMTYERIGSGLGYSTNTAYARVGQAIDRLRRHAEELGLD